ncbi:YeeE/YedE family protein [Vibrio alginolyticus]|nr:YeeE/YedE family protein [Vibrio alginolyticus]
MAVEELIIQKRYEIFKSFVKIVIWVFGVTVLFELFGFISPARNENYAFRPEAMIGGIIFGMGAVINGGCSMNTLIQFCRGRFALIFSFLGFSLGVVAAGYASSFQPNLQAVKIKPFDGFSILQLWIFAVLFVAWGIYEFYSLCKGASASTWKRRFKSEHYDKSLSAAILGICNGILVVLVGIWVYSNLIIMGLLYLMFDQEGMSLGIYYKLSVFLFVAMLLGILISAKTSHTFNLDFEVKANYLFGGFLMGVGAVFVPGGNDVVLLNSIPTLSLQAVPSYVSMLLGMALLIILKRNFQKT